MERAQLDGKFFRVGAQRFLVRGVTYGAFAPNNASEPFPEPGQAGRDLDAILKLGANTVRVYDVPPPWLLDAAASRGLRLLVSVPWTVQSCFLDSRTSRREVRTAVTAAVQSLGGHPAVLAVAVGNEIPPDIVRWSGDRRAARFLDELITAARQAAPDFLYTYANYPPTEFLQSVAVDFVTFNVFLHSRSALVSYLAHLQMLADGKPLILGECGIDARREGADRQAEILSWTLAAALAGGVAGAIVFSFTDEWCRAGVQVLDWEMGLTTRSREPRPAFAAVQARFHENPPQPPRAPRVSVVVACYNGAVTLRACLESLLQLNHPDYEIIVIDDGSTDDTPLITSQFPGIRTLRVRENMGLSHARNLGIRTATGEIIAFTDADCRADRDWLRFLVAGLLDAPVAGIGGPNLLPPEDGAIAALIMAAPGGPAHVMLDDRFAEHVPGCNMAFWKWALEAIGGFDPVFHQAGDDVDVCWRLQRRGWRIAFSPAGFVWHHRRPTVGAYLRQQAGYGHAEALLLRKHPAHFNALGAARWRGRIHTQAELDLPWSRPSIYRGIFATAPFQTLYAPVSDSLLPALTSLEYHVLVAWPALVMAFVIDGLWPWAVLAWAAPLGVSVFAAQGVVLHRNQNHAWSRPLLILLYFVQPVVRGIARYAGRFGPATEHSRPSDSLESAARVYSRSAVEERAYWSPNWRDRREWIVRIVAALEKLGWPCRADAGWDEFDLEIFGRTWSRIVLVTATEASRDSAQILRCRLSARWTFAGHVLLWGTISLLVALFGVFDVSWKLGWIPALGAAALLVFLRQHGRVLQCRLSVVLDEVARDWGLVNVKG